MRTVLIVDDDAGVRTLVRMTLEGSDYELLEADDGRSALQLARERRPDLVLLDVMLPDLSGIDICRAIKADDDLAPVKVVMLSAKAQAADISDAETVGADDYFTKPFSPLGLLDKVESMLGASA